MGLFNDLFGRGKPVACDPTEGHPHVPVCMRALSARDGAALARAYDDMVPADRAHCLDILGAITQIGQPLPRPGDDARLAAINGSLLYVWAHRSRGFATGDRVSEAAGLSMLDLASQADEALSVAARARPGDSTIKAFQLRTRMLLDAGPDAVSTVLKVIASGSEQNVFAHAAALNYLAPKWFGSHEEMHAVADLAISRGGTAAMYALKARAHIEDWLFDVHMSDDETRKRAFLHKSATREFAASLAALDDAFRASAARSPMSFSEAAFARNQFAVLFGIFDNPDRLRPHIEAIGNAPMPVPWSFAFDLPLASAVADLRRRAGL